MTDQPTPSAVATPAQVVARKVLDFYGGDASRWTKGVLAKTASGRMTYCESPDATCWCIVGAMYATSGDGLADIGAARHAVVRIVGRAEAQFNDDPTTTFADVVSVLERIAAGEGAAS
jgi:hypothetical protein